MFLIVDNLKVHHAAKVTTWVAAHAHEIELFYLPAYAPDHNPDENLNNDLKQQLRQQPQPSSQLAPCCAPSSAHLGASGLLQAADGPLCRLIIGYNGGILVFRNGCQAVLTPQRKR